jgi:hypothetical protein
MQLPDRTVRDKMLGLALPLKEEMLRSASAAFPTTLTAPSRSTHQRGRSLNVEASIPVQRAPQSKKEGVKSAFLRKTKSSVSLRATSSASASSVLEPPRRPGHTRTSSATSVILRSLGRSSGTAVTKEQAAAGGEAAEDATWWAVRVRSSNCKSLEVKEVGRLRGRLRNEAPR